MHDMKTALPNLIPSNNVKVEDFEDEAYILAFKDSRSSKVVTYHANQKNRAAMQYLVDKAVDFFEENCGFLDFEAKTYDVEDSEYRVITAINMNNSKREIIHISTKCDRGSNQDFFNVSDIAGAILGLIAVGPLNFSDEAILQRAAPQSESVDIVIAHLLPTAKTLVDDKVVNIGRCIVNITSNDQFYTKITQSSVPGFLYSTTANISRRKLLPKEGLCPSAKSEFKNVWISSGCYNPLRYFKHEAKTEFKPKYAASSLLLSNNFFELYSRLSNKSFRLEISQFKGVKDCYQASINKEPGSRVFDFIPAPSLDISVSSNGIVLKQNAILSKNLAFFTLIVNCWDRPSCLDYDYRYEYKMPNDFSEVVSHWLWFMLVHHYFDEKTVPSCVVKSQQVFSSVVIKKAFVYAESIPSGWMTDILMPLHSPIVDPEIEISFWDHLKRFKSVGDIESIYNFKVTEFEAVRFVFSAGIPMFQIACAKEEPSSNSYWALYVSDAESGFLNSDSSGYTLIETDVMGDVKSVYCYAIFSSAFKKIIEVIAGSSTAKANNMDNYDILRSVSNVAAHFDCFIDMGFHVSNNASWRLSSR